LDLLVPHLKSRLSIVDHATDSEELLDLVRFYDDDVVMLHLSDGRPPDIDLIHRLRGAGLRAPLLVLAAQLSEAGRLRVFEAGADELVVQATSHEEIFGFKTRHAASAAFRMLCWNLAISKSTPTPSGFWWMGPQSRSPKKNIKSSKSWPCAKAAC
jgi:DNA-binding NarL/FixJ family response regulator